MSQGQPNPPNLRNVAILAAVAIGIFLVLAILDRFTEWVDVVPWVAGLLFAATAVIFAGLSQALRTKPHEARKLLFIIVATAISLRAVALLTSPILEVDYYRYIWDGKVLASGVSPYAYSPQQIRNADVSVLDQDYRKVVALSQVSDSNSTILSKVHFAQYTTIYPPVSQFIFAAAMKYFPVHANVWSHITFLRIVLVIFDLLTVFILWKLMVERGIHLAWLISYAWNPLVIKEVANSGHLDSIAVFFLMLAFYSASSWQLKDDEKSLSWRIPFSGFSLALGFGAKLFPVILVPIFALSFAKHRRAAAVVFLVAFLLPAAFITGIFNRALADRAKTQERYAAQKREQQSSEGLSSFLTTWRMNDVVFSCLYLNLSPEAEAGSQVPWYVVTSKKMRLGIHSWLSRRSIGGEDLAFLLARFITVAGFALIYAWVLLSAYREQTQFDAAKYSWILVVFLFLQPTVNPWYWLWIAPLASLSQRKEWILVSGLLLTYYLRFWFSNQTLTISFLGKAYSGVEIFDDFIAWLEFVAIVVVLLIFNRQQLGRVMFKRDKSIALARPNSIG